MAASMQKSHVDAAGTGMFLLRRELPLASKPCWESGKDMGGNMEPIRLETDHQPESQPLQDEMEILYVLQGRCAVMEQQRNYVLGADDFSVFTMFASYELYRKEYCHTLSFFIPSNAISDMNKENRKIFCVTSMQPEKKVFSDLIRSHLAEILLEFLEHSDQVHRGHIFSEVYAILAILYQEFDDGEKTGLPMDERQRKQEILQFLWQHSAEDLTLHQAAAHFYLSDGHFSRLFRNLIGESFSDTLRTIRLQQVRRMLLAGNENVTEIAQDCGFSSVNTMILDFRVAYGMTPGKFRKQHVAGSPSEERNADGGEISYMGLLHYRGGEPVIGGRQSGEVGKVSVRLTERGREVRPIWKKLAEAGYAKDLLYSKVQQALIRIQEDIGVEGFKVHGIFNDDLNVCTRQQDGSLRFNFAYVDMILDFIVEDLHGTPWLAMDYTPSCLVDENHEKLYFGSNLVTLPTDLEGWRELVQAMIHHLIRRYGKERAGHWYYSFEQAVQVDCGTCTLHEYEIYHLVSFQAVREILPQARIYGFGTDSGHMLCKDNRTLYQLLAFAKQNDCLPDLLSLQCFCCDWEKADMLERSMNHQETEPVPLSSDINVMQRGLLKVLETEKELNCSIPLVITDWNVGLWGRAPGNDTCFLAAAMVRAVALCEPMLEAFSFTATDYHERELQTSGLFHGGGGLFTYSAIPKAEYVALQLLNQIRGRILAQGEGWLLTYLKEAEEFWLLLYHFCPYESERRKTKALSEAEEGTYDRYFQFRHEGSKSFRIFLSKLPEGVYQLVTETVNRVCGSSYDAWMEMGAPIQLTSENLNYLECHSIPGKFYQEARTDRDGKLILSLLIQPHEVRLIHGIHQKISIE